MSSLYVKIFVTILSGVNSKDAAGSYGDGDIFAKFSGEVMEERN